MCAALLYLALETGPRDVILSTETLVFGLLSYLLAPITVFAIGVVVARRHAGFRPGGIVAPLASAALLAGYQLGQAASFGGDVSLGAVVLGVASMATQLVLLSLAGLAGAGAGALAARRRGGRPAGQLDDADRES
jgi:hypothetical protein